MIHYRSGMVTRPFSRVYDYSDGPYGAAVMLPTVAMSPSSLAAEYAVTRAGDHITTSKSVNIAGDHMCFHSKVEGALEGMVSSPGIMPNQQFLSFSGTVPYSGGTRKWVTSSGSGPTVLNRWDSSQHLSVIGPGLLSEASMTCESVDTQYTGLVRRGLITQYQRVVCVDSNSFLWIRCLTYCPTDKSQRNDGRLSCSIGLFTPKLRSVNRQQWEYNFSSYRSYQKTSTSTAKLYVYNPEVFYSKEIDDAIFDASNTLRVVDIASLEYNVSLLQTQYTSSGVATATADAIARAVSKFADRVAASATPPDKNVWSDLCVTAIQSCQQLNINSIAYAKDLIGLKSEISAIKQLVLGWKNPKTYLKAFLSYQYGVRLTMSDTKSLVTSLEEETKIWTKGYSAVRARSSDSPSTSYHACKSLCRLFNYKVYYSPIDNGVLNCIRGLMDWDLWPTLQNDWDLIPLSFVLDWFVSVEDLCNRLDACIYSQYLDVFSVLRTTKTIGDISCDLSHYGINDARIAATWYNRTYSSNLDLPSFYLDTNSGFLTHLPELSSIMALFLHK